MEQMPAGTVLVPCVFGDPGVHKLQELQVAYLIRRGVTKKWVDQEIRHLYPW